MSDIIDIGSITKDSVAGLQAGMDIAAKSEAIKHQRQALEQQRQEFEVKKWHSTWDSVRGIALEADPVIRDAMAEDFSKTFGELYGQRPNPALMKAMTKSDRFKESLLAFTKASQAMLSKDPEKYLGEVAPQLEQAFVGDISNTIKQLHQFNMESVRLRQAEAMAGRQSVSQERVDLGKQRLAIAAAKAAAEAGSKITNDKQIVSYNSIIDQTDAALNLLENEKLPRTVQRFNDAQIEFTNAIAGSRNSALGKLERTEMDSIQAKAENLKQKMTGKPGDAVPIEQWKLLTDMMKEFKAVKQFHRRKRAEELKRTYKGFPGAQEEQALAMKHYEVEPGLESGAGIPKPAATSASTEPSDRAKAQQLTSEQKTVRTAYAKRSIANIKANPALSEQMKRDAIAQVKVAAAADGINVEGE